MKEKSINVSHEGKGDGEEGETFSSGLELPQNNPLIDASNEGEGEGEGEREGGKTLSGLEQPQKEPSIDDVLAYLKKVEDAMLEKKKKEYDEFMNVMEDFKARKIGATSVIAKVNELFKGYEDLILGFNSFLRSEYMLKGCKIELEPQLPDVLKFVGKVRNRFEGNEDDDVFKSFLDIMTLHTRGFKSFTDAHNEISSLLIDHTDLFDEFNGFFPPHHP